MVPPLFLVQERCRKPQQQVPELFESKRESKQSQGRGFPSLIYNIMVLTYDMPGSAPLKTPWYLYELGPQ